MIIDGVYNSTCQRLYAHCLFTIKVMPVHVTEIPIEMFILNQFRDGIIKALSLTEGESMTITINDKKTNSNQIKLHIMFQTMLKTPARN